MPGSWTVYLGNLGDSRAVVFDRQFNVIGCTVEHKPTAPGEEERVVAAGGWVDKSGPGPARICHPKCDVRLAVSRALGDGDLKPVVSSEPDVVHVQIPAAGGWVLLGCDGVWDKPQLPAEAGRALSGLILCGRGACVEVRDDDDDEVEDWKPGVVVARAAAGELYVRPEGSDWPKDDIGVWNHVRPRGAGKPQSARQLSHALRRFVQSCVLSRDNVSAVLVDVPPAGRHFDPAAPPEPESDGEEYLPAPPLRREVKLLPPSGSGSVSYRDADGSAVTVREVAGDGGGNLQYSIDGEWRGEFRILRYDSGDAGGEDWPAFLRIPQLGTMILLPTDADALAQALSGVYHLAASVRADFDVCVVPGPCGDVFLPSIRPAAVGDRVVLKPGPGGAGQAHDPVARFRVIGGLRHRLSVDDVGFRLQPGEEAEVVEVDADGDVRLRDSSGQLSQWTYSSTYSFSSGGAPGPRLAPCAASFGSTGAVSWAAGYMQGSRHRMEDAHACGLLRGGALCFGVFDGHGDGGRVARAAATGEGLERRPRGVSGARRALQGLVRRVKHKMGADTEKPAPARHAVFDAAVATSAWTRRDHATAIAGGIRDTDRRILTRLKPPASGCGACALVAFLLPPQSEDSARAAGSPPRR